MQPLEQLIAEAEVERVLQICNACRYCEGFCAVFPAMTRRLDFPAADVHYLANLCHNCGACLHACQYAPPHEFAVNLPQAMARVRAKTYAEHAWPQPLGALYKNNGLTLALALVAALTLFLALGAASTGRLWGVVQGGFYAIFPHGLMVALFAPVFLFAALALAIGVRRFWRGAPPGSPSSAAVGEAVHDALRLKYLDGGHGQGCHNDDDAWTLDRRRAHHLVFYGFLLCFAATSVATLYHYVFGWAAPYGWTSLPKLLGTVGGVMLCIGCAWLWQLRSRRHPQHLEASQAAMDKGFIALLFVTAASGLLLALLRGTAALPLALCLHLGAVMALFATLPYGKFAHGIYRSAALLKWAIEKRRPSNLRLGSE
ncbi:MAG: tricarballylate utilization 4Fe-4S protein TcuB [Rubrivivax sp.]